MARPRRAELQVPIFKAHEFVDGVLTLHLPWPPSVNAYWRAAALKGTSRVIVFTTKEAKQYREDVGWLCVGAHKFGPSAEILLDITLYPPDARRRDADNFNKCVWDALVAAEIFHDDCQVMSYRVTKGAVVSGGQIVIKIWERKDAESQEHG
jgi:crossover junction endodeoxyribonuclease RusA